MSNQSGSVSQKRPRESDSSDSEEAAVCSPEGSADARSRPRSKQSRRDAVRRRALTMTDPQELVWYSSFSLSLSLFVTSFEGSSGDC